MIRFNLTGEFAFNQDIFNYALWFSQIFGTSFNIFTIFVICIYRGSEMKSYRTHLLLYQIFSSLLDFGMDTLAQPVFFLPIMGGTAQGLLHSLFGISTFTIWTCMMTFGGFCLHFIIYSPLLYRWQVLLPERSVLKFSSDQKRRLYEIIQLAIATPSTYLAMSVTYEDPVMAFDTFKKSNPNDYYLTTVKGFYVLNPQNNSNIIIYNIYSVTWIAFLVGSAVYMSLSCINVLNSTRCHMSQKTKSMHRRFLKNILLQALIPMLLIEIPVLYWIIITLGDIRFPGCQNVTNFTVWCLGVHGLLGSIIVFYLNPCFRVVVKGWIRRFLNIHTTTSVSIMEVTAASSGI